MATAIASFRQKVLREVTGCPNFLIDEVVIDTLIEFCEDTSYWQEDLADHTIIKTIHTYSIIAPTDALIVNITSVQDDGTPVNPKTEDQLDREWPRFSSQSLFYSHGSQTSSPWRTIVADTATYYYLPDIEHIRLVGIPTTNKVNKLTIRASLKPTYGATVVGDVLFNEFYEDIAYGAKARLFEMADKDWANPGKAAEYRGKFLVAMKEAKSRVVRGHIRNTRGSGRSRTHY